jgi:hypothetical protein
VKGVAFDYWRFTVILILNHGDARGCHLILRSDCNFPVVQYREPCRSRKPFVYSETRGIAVCTYFIFSASKCRIVACPVCIPQGHQQACQRLGFRQEKLRDGAVAPSRERTHARGSQSRGKLPLFFRFIPTLRSDFLLGLCTDATAASVYPGLVRVDSIFRFVLFGYF